jgi:hypothetical protein
MNDITILFIILGVVIVLFVTEKIPVVLVALGTALALYFKGILTLGQALGGLGDSSTIFIASLFVVMAVSLNRSPSQLLMPLVWKC